MRPGATGNKKPAQRYSVKALKQVLADTALAVFFKRPQAEYQIGAMEIIDPNASLVNPLAVGADGGGAATHTRHLPTR
jgi:hypothetical protein